MKNPNKAATIIVSLQLLVGILFSISIITGMSELSQLPERYNSSSALASSAIQATQLSNAMILEALPLIGGILQKLALFIIIFLCLKALKSHLLTPGADKGTSTPPAPAMAKSPAPVSQKKKAPAKKVARKKEPPVGPSAV